MGELLSAFTEFFKEFPETYKPALLPVIITMLFFKIWFRAIYWNQEAGLIKLPAVKKKERLESINFLAEQIKNSLNEPEEILYMQEKRYALLFEEIFGFSANKSMRRLINDFQAVAPFPMNNSKFISNASRYLFNEDNRLMVKLDFCAVMYMFYCVCICILYVTSVLLILALIFERMSFSSMLIFLFLSVCAFGLLIPILNDIVDFMGAKRIKAFLEKDNPKRTFQQWLQSVVRSFKSLAWMPKFNFRSSKAPLQKMAHAEEPFE
jgi:hypothetical protein